MWHVRRRRPQAAAGRAVLAPAEQPGAPLPPRGAMVACEGALAEPTEGLVPDIWALVREEFHPSPPRLLEVTKKHGGHELLHINIHHFWLVPTSAVRH